MIGNSIYGQGFKSKHLKWQNDGDKNLNTMQFGPERSVGIQKELYGFHFKEQQPLLLSANIR